jgi:hypothetical protein
MRPFDGDPEGGARKRRAHPGFSSRLCDGWAQGPKRSGGRQAVAPDAGSAANRRSSKGQGAASRRRATRCRRRLVKAGSRYCSIAATAIRFPKCTDGNGQARHSGQPHSAGTHDGEDVTPDLGWHAIVCQAEHDVVAGVGGWRSEGERNERAQHCIAGQAEYALTRAERRIAGDGTDGYGTDRAGTNEGRQCIGSTAEEQEAKTAESATLRMMPAAMCDLVLADDWEFARTILALLVRQS